MSLQTIYYIIAIGILLGGLLWKASDRFTRVGTLVLEIRDNHLKHISEDLGDLKSRVTRIESRMEEY